MTTTPSPDGEPLSSGTPRGADYPDAVGAPVAAHGPVAAPAPVAAPGGDVPRLRAVACAAVMALATAGAVLVGRDGRPGWQVVRVLALLLVAAGLLAVVRRASRVVVGLMALALGALGTGVGAVAGGPHLVKGGSSLVTGAGLVAAAGGLVLVVVGVVALAGAVGRWWRVPVALVAVVLVVPLALAGGVAVAATNPPLAHLGPETPADRGLTYTDVAFPAADGVPLAGWYVPGDSGTAVVLLHGAGSTRSAVLGHLVALVEQGFGVLAVDARGHGGSGGRAMDLGWFGDADVTGAVTFVLDQPGVDRVAVVGLSMGGEEALGAAAADPRIGAVVAEGATGRVAGDGAWLPDVYGVQGVLQRPTDWLTQAATDLLTEAGPPRTLRAAVESSSCPVLLIAAGEVADEAHAARFIAAGAPDRVDVWVVAGAGHTGGLAADEREWTLRVTTFLDAALGD